MKLFIMLQIAAGMRSWLDEEQSYFQFAIITTGPG